MSVLLDAYGEACAHGRDRYRLKEIAAAAVQNRLGALLVEAGWQSRCRPGHLRGHWPAERCSEVGPGSSVILDDLAEAPLRTGGG